VITAPSGPSQVTRLQAFAAGASITDMSTASTAAITR
jgi:hypothetical protein